MKKICLIDLEFIDNKEIISIGAITIYKENGYYRTGDNFYSLIKPRFKKLTSFYQELTHITQEDLDNAPCFEEVFSKFYDFIFTEDVCYNNTKLFTWGYMDKKVLSTNAIIGNYQNKNKKLYNKIENLSKKMIDIQPIISSTITYNKSIISKTLSLDNIKKIYNLYGQVSHNSFQDAKDLKDVYLCYKNNHSLNIEYLKELYDKNEKDKKEIHDNRYEKLQYLNYSNIDIFNNLYIDNFNNIFKKINKCFYINHNKISLLKKDELIWSKPINDISVKFIINRKEDDIYINILLLENNTPFENYNFNVNSSVYKQLRKILYKKDAA